MIYLSYNKSLNICKTLQNYSQDISYYKTVKKVHKKVVKNFNHFTTFTLPLYGNQMNRTSLKSSCAVPRAQNFLFRVFHFCRPASIKFISTFYGQTFLGIKQSSGIVIDKKSKKNDQSCQEPSKKDRY